MSTRQLGKREARHDPRIPRMHDALPSLAAPPDEANWMADVPVWKMLANDVAGNCTYAASMHYIMQQSAYANPGNGLIGLDTEAITNYTVGTGYDPNNPATDQGQYMLGNNGLIQQWATKGLLCGGKTNIIRGAVAIDPHNGVQLRQAIDLFGAALVGVQFPAQLERATVLPFVWTAGGPSAGGHEIILPGYLKVGGTFFYDIVSWGDHYRITEYDLMQIIDEALAVIDPIGMNARGVNGHGLNDAAMVSAMRSLAVG